MRKEDTFEYSPLAVHLAGGRSSGFQFAFEMDCSFLLAKLFSNFFSMRPIPKKLLDLRRPRERREVLVRRLT